MTGKIIITSHVRFDKNLDQIADQNIGSELQSSNPRSSSQLTDQQQIGPRIENEALQLTESPLQHQHQPIIEDSDEDFDED